MAGAGYKLFATGDVLTAAQVNTYLQEQVVMVFANAAARTTALSGVLAEGMVTYLKDTDALEIYSGSAWVGYGSGDITGITTGATSGLTGGVTSGTADLKFNTSAKGGLLVGTGSGTVSELTVGSNNTVLTADSTTATGLKWAAAAGGGSLTKIKTATFSNVADTGTTFDSVFTSTYNNYKVIFWNVYTATNAVDFRFQLRNGGTTQNTAYYGNYVIGVTKTDIPNAAQFTMGQLRNNSVQATALDMTVFRNNNRLAWFFNGVERTSNYTIFGGGFSDNVASNGADGFILSTSSGNIYGTVSVYGYEA